MPNVSQTGIEFEIKGTTGSATKAIDRLMGSLVKLDNFMQTSQGIKNYKANSAALQSSIKTLSKNLLKLTGTGIKKGLKGMLSLAGWPPKAAIAGLKSYTSGLSKVAAGFKRIMFYRAIRGAIKAITDGVKEGTENLYKWSQVMGGAASASGMTFAQSMDSIATSMLYFKNSIGAAVAPLISALAPVIDMVIDKIVTLLNLINQLFAKLTGASSWNKAIKKTTQYGEAVSGAGEAAKEALRYLAPFDELNVLPADNESSSGGGGGGQDYSDMFEEVSEFNEALADFADSIKEKVQAADWQGLGELLGNKINDVVNSINFGYYGSKVGEYINAWFTTRYWTLETINFENIGARIGQFLNNALFNIDFDILGRTLTQKFTIVGDFLIGAIETINWGQVTSKLSDLIIGAFDQLSEWIQSVDWDDFGSTLWNALKDAVEGIDFGGIASSMMNLLGSAIGGAVTLVYSFVSDAISDIWGYFISFASDENGDGEIAGGEIVEGVLKGLINAWKNIKSWLKTNIWDPFVEGLKSTFGIHSPATTMEEPGQMIGEGILEGILKPFKTIALWVKEHIVDPIVNAIKSTIEDAPNLLTIGQNILDNMLTGIQNGWTLMKAWFSDNFVRGIAQFGIDAANGLLTPVENMINGVIDDINGMTGNLPEWVRDKFGLGEIDHVDLTVIPNLDPPVGTYYQQTKEEIEAEAKKKPTALTSTAVMTAAVDSLTEEAKEIGTKSKYTSSDKTALSKAAKTISTWANYTASSMGLDKKERTIKTWANYTASTVGLTQKERTISTWASYDSRKSTLTDKERTISTWAAYDSRKNNLNEAARTISTWASYNGVKNNLSDRQRTIDTTANYTDYQDSIYGTPKIDATASFTDWEDNIPESSKTIGMTASITGVSGGLSYLNADGGVYSGGSWRDIARYAGGGLAKGSQLFWARETGSPELVGTLGGHTAVMNNDQIVSSVAYGVQKAISSIRFQLTGFSSAYPTQQDSGGMDEESIYRAMLRALNDSDVFPDEIDLDGAVVYRKMVQRNRMEKNRTGVNPMMAS